MPQLDVLYMTRIQKERFVDPLEYERLKGVYVLNRGKLRAARKELLILHPLPRVDEISPEVDADPRAVYFQQARCGMFARMALLLRQIALGREEPDLTPREGARVCRNPSCITAAEQLPPLTEAGRCIYCDKEADTCSHS